MGMKWTSWAFLAFVGSLLFLVLYIKDSEIKGGVDRLSHVKAPQHSETNAEKQGKYRTRSAVRRPLPSESDHALDLNVCS